MNPLLPACILCIAAISACSAEGYRREADEEVYEILGAKWKPALGEEAEAVPFQVEAPPTSLRQRLLQEISRGERPVVELRLPQALEVAAENSREFQDQKERLYLSALALTGQRNRYTTIFGAGNESTVSGTGDDSVEGSTRTSASASRLMASGARVLGSFVNSFFRVFTSGGGWNTTSLLSLSITQPLLEGFGREVTLEPLTQAERNTIYAVRSYERFRRTFSVKIMSEYLSVLEAQNNLQNAENNTKSLQRNRERSEELAKAGRLDKFELDQARQRELSAQDQEVVTRARLKSSMDGFKITLGLPMEIELRFDPGVVARLKEIGVGGVALSEDEAVKLALAQRLDLINAREQVVDAERGVRVAANALQMGLDLSAAVSVPNADSKEPFNMDWNKFQWEVGLALDLPLNKVPERNVYRQSMIALDAELRALSLLEDNITLSIRNALRDVQAAFSSYRIQEMSLALARERVDSTQLLLEAGRVQTRDFLDAQDDLLAAENALISALVDYVNNRLLLLRDLETLDVGTSGLALDLESLRRWMQPAEEAPAKKEEHPQ